MQNKKKYGKITKIYMEEWERKTENREYSN